MLYVSDLVFSTSNMRVLNIGFHMLVELLPLVQTADEVSDLWLIWNLCKSVLLLSAVDHGFEPKQSLVGSELG